MGNEHVKFVVLSGAISCRLKTYKKAFKKAEGKATREYPNALIFNPATLGDGKPPAVYMKVCLDRICDISEQYPNQGVVYVLKGYEKSKGSLIEVALAEYCKMKVVYE